MSRGNRDETITIAIIAAIVTVIAMLLVSVF